MILTEENTQLLNECIKQDNTNPLEYKILKLSEEVGELVSEFLKLKNTSNASVSAEGSVKELYTEAIDVYLVIADVIKNIENFECDDCDFQEILNKKLVKWKTKLNKRKENEQ